MAHAPTSLVARVRASEPGLALCAAIALAWCAAGFAVSAWTEFNLQDEAFVWYGTLRVLEGELPLRDFRSYDPGRYFWSAAWSALFGEGLIAQRASQWSFAVLGITAGLLVVRRATSSAWWLAAAGGLLAAWMPPPWKIFEASFALVAMLASVRLIERPTARRIVIAGVVAGLAAFFGRNLGVYAAVGLGASTLFAVWKRDAALVKSGATFCAGIVIGYAPMLALTVFASGYREAFVDSIAFYLRQNALNAEMPFPWPWAERFANRKPAGVVFAVSRSAFFTLPIVAYALFGVRAALARKEDVVKLAPLAGIACVGGAWFHHASVRSDLSHLAQSFHPFLVGALCLPLVVAPARAALVRAGACSLLALLSILPLERSLPFVARFTAGPSETHVPLDVAGARIHFPPDRAYSIGALVACVRDNVPDEAPFFASAHFLGLYLLLDRRAPTWDIYPAWAADEREQDRMLADLEGIDWAVLDSKPIGNDPRMRLPVSHPRVWAMLQRDFERIAAPGATETFFLLRRRER